MKFQFSALVLAVMLFFTACTAQKKSASSDLSYVSMQRTACFGKCPVYKLEIYKDGLVRYTAIQFTPDSGVYEKNIGEEKAQKLLNSFAAHRPDTLQKEYNMPIADLPGINIVFKKGNTVKEVRNAEFGPMFLKELSLEMDELVKENPGALPEIDRSWKKISNSPKGD